jgi:2-polyprenyl-3-methyl-5-hydroxy-6-metoxy-1,4-benzoquinol methylase
MSAFGNYDGVAAEYQRAKQEPWRRWVEGFTLFEMLGDVAGKAVLDLACGEGFYSRQLRQRGAAVLGVDLSPQMIRLARAEEAQRPLGIEYQVGDAAALNLAERFDLVLAAYLLNNAQSEQELTAMGRSIARSLRPGGRLVAVTNNPAQPLEAFGATLKYGFVKRVAGPLREGTPITYTLFLGASSFEFDHYYLSVETHERALHAAGLDEVRWHGPRVSPEGNRERGESYWAELVTQPAITFLTCTKSR